MRLKKRFYPKVSVLIPVLEGTDFAIRAVKSVAGQKYKNVEVIVVDYTSNFEKYFNVKTKRQNLKIRYYKCKKNDLSDLLRLGISKMTGEYMAILSENDTYSPDKIGEQVMYLSALADKTAILFTAYEENGKSHSITGEHSYTGKKELLIFNTELYIPTLMLHRDHLRKSNYKNINESRSIVDTCLAALSKGADVKYLNKALVRRGPSSDKYKFDINESEAINYLKNLSDADAERMYGSVYNFNVQMKIIGNARGFSELESVANFNINNLNKAIVSKIKSSKSRVFAITPLYNRAKMIEEVMRSVEAQTYKNYTYIIIDDGSKDNSGEVVSRFIKGKKNWHYIYHSNIGEAETVNFGWSLSKGEYFVQINSDDPVKENLFLEMTKSLDANKDCVLGYCDFDITDAKGRTIQTVNSPDYDFLRDLSEFSCYAASPGAFIRKSPFKDLTKIKDARYKHTNDIKMLWNMSLRGNFLHVPINLATWRSHEDGISSNRYEAIPEIEEWIREYFKQSLPNSVKDIKGKCMQSIYKYFVALLENSNSPSRDELVHYYKRKTEVANTPYINLQIGDNDLIGNKFNGHDLHIALRNRGIDSSHLVWNKDSKDPDTYLIAGEKEDRFQIRKFIDSIQGKYDLDNLGNPLIFDIFYNKLFVESDVVHLHLLHNGLWDLNALPLMSRMKPIVWTVHDMWISTGHNISKERPDYYFPLPGKNNIDINWFFKQRALEEASIDYVVASEYMLNAMKEYPLFKKNNIHLVPFGLDFNIFYPRDKKITRNELGYNDSEIILLYRGDGGERKGLRYIDKIIRSLGNKYDIHFIVVGGNDVPIPKGIKSTWYGWVKDDDLMAKLYSISDLLLMPSTRENFGMMAIEAMACGTVPVVIDGTALPETVNAPVCGVSTPQIDSEYVAAVEELLLDSQERLLRSKKGIKYVKEKHSMEKYLNSLNDIYINAIKNFILDKEAKNIIENIKKHNLIIPRTSYIDSAAFHLKTKGITNKNIVRVYKVARSLKRRGTKKTLKILYSRSKEKINVKTKKN